MQCNLCEKDAEVESETHLLTCSKITENLDPSINLDNAYYEDIFSDNIEDQVAITKIFDLVLKKRNMLMK